MANTRLFVGNLDYGVTETELLDAFAEFGGERPRVMEGRGFGFIEVPVDRANDAIGGMDGAELKGRKMRVNEAHPRPERSGGGGGGVGGGGDRGGYGGAVAAATAVVTAAVMAAAAEAVAADAAATIAVVAVVAIAADAAGNLHLTLTQAPPAIFGRGRFSFGQTDLNSEGPGPGLRFCHHFECGVEQSGSSSGS